MDESGSAIKAADALMSSQPSIERSWRGEGEPLFAVLFLAVFAVEAVMLALLSWALLFREDSGSAGTLRNVLVAAVSTAALLLTVATVSILLYRAVAGRRERHRVAEVKAWMAVWQDVIAGKRSPPDPPLEEPAVEALLDLRESLGTTDTSRASQLISSLGATGELIDRVRAITPTVRRDQHRRLRRRHLASLLSALDALAKARVADTVDVALPLVESGDPAIRALALRAVARSIAAVEDGAARDRAAIDLASALARRQFSRGSLDEALLLLEKAAPAAVTSILTDPSADTTLVASALDTVGRLKLSELVGTVCARLQPDAPAEVQAAALRALANLSPLPAVAKHQIGSALASKNEIVRTQACHAAWVLPPEQLRRELVPLLGDPSWWVRRAAATSLIRAGGEGRRLLTWAAMAHPDRYGRDMANEVLGETERSLPGEVA
jgi:hypothetical protein